MDRIDLFRNRQSLRIDCSNRLMVLLPTYVAIAQADPPE